MIKTVDGKQMEPVADIVFFDPKLDQSHGTIQLEIDANKPLSSVTIRNFGKYPIRLNRKKTIPPGESWTFGSDEIGKLNQKELSFKYLMSTNTGASITAINNDRWSYSNDYAIEIEGTIITYCECKKFC